MKQKTKTLSDVDTRGRVRRVQVYQERPQMVKAKFLDGPLKGREIEVPRGEDYVRFGPFVYSWAGREGRTPLYCKLPKRRLERRILMFVIGKRGADPRVDMAAMRPKPKVGSVDPRGRGRRRRAAAHAA